MTTEKKKVLLPLHMAHELMENLLFLYYGAAANLGAKYYNDQNTDNLHAEGLAFARRAVDRVIEQLEKDVPIEVKWVDPENFS